MDSKNQHHGSNNSKEMHAKQDAEISQTLDGIKNKILVLAIVLAFISLGTIPSANGQPNIIGETYGGIDYCSLCHENQVLLWEGSSHSKAFNGEAFQEQWEKLDSPTSCLSCHTTGFEEEDSSYIFEDVTCEACHGPGDTMNIDGSVDLCAGCHSDPYPTFEEWKMSGPSQNRTARRPR